MKRQLLPLLLCTLPLAVNAQSAAPATVDEFLADPKVGSGIAYEVTTPNYGFFIHQKGYLLALHDKDGKILVDNIGEFILQRQTTNESGGVRHEHAGYIRDEAVNATVDETNEGMDKAYEIKIDAPNLDIQLLVVCKPDGPVLNYKIAAKGFPEDSNLSALIPVNFNKSNADSSEVEPNVNPVILYGSDDSSLSIDYSTNFKPYNKSGPAVVVGKSAMSFYPFAGLQPVSDGTEIPLELVFSFGK